MKHNYFPNFIDSFIKSFLNKLYKPKVIAHNVPKRNVFVKLPFLASPPFQIRKKRQKLFSLKLSFCNLKIVFKNCNDFQLKIMENLLIARDKTCLKKGNSSFRLDLF